MEIPRQFSSDGEHSTQHIYNEIAYPLVEGVMEGCNGTIFAYGQTGSGKSFTMQEVQILPHREGSFPGHLNTSLSVYSVLKTPRSC